MPGEPRRVVILYDHPLLGEGLERLLRVADDLAIELVRVDGIETATAALAGDPDVVILERCPALDAVELLRFAPRALFIDVGLDPGPSWTLRRDELSPLPEELLKVIHERARAGARPEAKPGPGGPAPAETERKAAAAGA